MVPMKEDGVSLLGLWLLVLVVVLLQCRIWLHPINPDLQIQVDGDTFKVYRKGKWEDASGKVDDVWGQESSSLIYKGVTYWNKGYHTMSQSQAATMYANAKVPKFDSDKLDEYTDLDMEYSTMVAMYDTLVEELQAMADGTKEQLSTEAQDTHLIQ